MTLIGEKVTIGTAAKPVEIDTSVGSQAGDIRIGSRTTTVERNSSLLAKGTASSGAHHHRRPGARGLPRLAAQRHQAIRLHRPDRRHHQRRRCLDLGQGRQLDGGGRGSRPARRHRWRHRQRGRQGRLAALRHRRHHRLGGGARDRGPDSPGRHDDRQLGLREPGGRDQDGRASHRHREAGESSGSAGRWRADRCRRRHDPLDGQHEPRRLDQHHCRQRHPDQRHGRRRDQGTAKAQAKGTQQGTGKDRHRQQRCEIRVAARHVP